MTTTQLPRRPDTRDRPAATSLAQESVRALRARLNRILCGKSDVIEQVLACLLARGHVLLEDKPGLGKTTLAKGLAAAIGGRFARIQCTPDLLPGDVTGFSLFNQQSQQFEFRPGPVFSDVLLTDEINRATPRTQSALLEAMAERQVTIDTVRHRLSAEFFVIATQNPIDQHGTYPLPEAQLDRFAMKLSIGYPDPQDELGMLQQALVAGADETDDEGPLFGENVLRELHREVAGLYVDPRVQEYLLAIGQASRRHPQVTLGVSPRGLLVWQRVAQARAFLNDRSFVTPDDLQETALPVLGVRLGVEHSHPETTIREILDSIPVPDAQTPRGRT